MMWHHLPEDPIPYLTMTPHVFRQCLLHNEEVRMEKPDFYCRGKFGVMHPCVQGLC